MPGSSLSEEWTGIIRYALFISIFARSAPGPRSIICLITSWMWMYAREVKEGLMPSFMLAPLGEDMSTISRHLLCWCRLGMMPIGLIWMGQGMLFG